MEVPERLAADAIARNLGADVSACVASRTVRGEGRGDELKPVAHDFEQPVHVLLVNPGVAVSTAEVFRRWNGVDHGPLGPDPLAGRNDLEPPARAIAPVIGEVLATLAAQRGVTLARMSGSGATCFALYRSHDAMREAADKLASRHPGWWQMDGKLR